MGQETDFAVDFGDEDRAITVVVLNCKPQCSLVGRSAYEGLEVPSDLLEDRGSCDR